VGRDGACVMCVCRNMWEGGTDIDPNRKGMRNMGGLGGTARRHLQPRRVNPQICTVHSLDFSAMYLT